MSELYPTHLQKNRGTWGGGGQSEHAVGKDRTRGKEGESKEKSGMGPSSSREKVVLGSNNASQASI